MNRKILSVFIVLILSTQFVQTARGLDTGPVNASLNGKTHSTSIEIKYWGFNFDEVGGIDYVKSFVQESNFAEEEEPGQYYTKAYSSYKGAFFWTIVNNIDYRVSYASTSEYQDLLSIFRDASQNSSLAGRYFINGTTEDIPGIRIPDSAASQYLEVFSDSDATYTIHVLNLQALDDAANNITHWFYNNPSLIYNDGGSDFRNAGIVSDYSLFFDPTAFVPGMTGTHLNLKRWQDLGLPDRKNYLRSSINNLVEQAIMGSPYSNPYGLPKLNEFSIHSAQVVLVNTSKPYASEVISSVSPTYHAKVFSLFDFVSEKSSRTAVIDINSVPGIKNYIYDNIVEVNGSKLFVVTNAASDFLKNTIRNTKIGLYREWPTGYFYLNMMWAFDEEIQVVYERNGQYYPYNQEIVGLGILDTSSWAKMSILNRSTISLTNLMLRTIGQVMGLHYTVEGPSLFIETPMSSYLDDKNGIINFNSFNKLQIMRKYSVIANISVTGILNDYREELKKKNYDFIPHDELDKAELIRINATILWQDGFFTEATAMYLDAYSTLLNAIQEVNSKISGLGNGIYWLIGLVSLVGIMSILTSYERRKRKTVPRDAVSGVPLEWIDTNLK